MPHPDEDKLAKYEISPKVPAHEQRPFVKAVVTVINSTRTEDMSTTETQLMRLSLKRHNVKPLELYQAMLDAYEDAYTPKSGIEWKHIFKHISQNRENTYIPPDDDTRDNS